MNKSCHKISCPCTCSFDYIHIHIPTHFNLILQNQLLLALQMYE
uniref:Uncharacterized protein n=1 Tax=Rhizophora mucronata TaxID=61149 RepID=A0A2P2QIX1_RHIMU